MGQRLVMALGATKRRRPGDDGEGLEEDGRGRKGAVHVGPALQARRAWRVSFYAYQGRARQVEGAAEDRRGQESDVMPLVCARLV